jgi:FKBP-type peptidyl-prolyl cis-trans isomerase
MTRRLTSLLACAALATALTACGGDEPADDPTVASPSASATAQATPCESAPPATEPVTTSTTDLATKPVIEVPDSAPPCSLQTADVVVGTGAEAVAGAQAQVKYVGVLFDTGEEFDSSWSRSAEETLPFELGAPGIIPGFDQGVTGMKVGGRREVIIPSDLAYGPSGQGAIPPGATLVFVIDLVEVTPA